MIRHMDYMDGLMQIPDGTVDLMVTDPPYLHVKGGMKSRRLNRGTWQDGSYMNREMSDFDGPAIHRFLDAALPKMKRVNAYIFCSKLQLVHYFTYIEKHRLKYDLLVWHKGGIGLKSTKFHTSDVEYIIRLYEPGVSLRKVWNADRTMGDYPHYLKCQTHIQPRGVHNTMKPLELIERLIRVSSDSGDTVLDPFLGSGTTAVACIRNDRRYIGFEINEDYYKIAEERIRDEQEGS